jgi:AcrR family transcriptional regulator
VLARAHVSRETFYERFRDKEDCFLAAYDAGVEAMVATLAAVRDEPASDALARFERTLGTYLDALAAEPAFAHTFLVEIYAAGPRALERRRAVLGRFADAVYENLGEELPDRFAAEMLVGAVVSLVTTRIGTGEVAALPALRRPVMDFARRLCAR